MFYDHGVNNYIANMLCYDAVYRPPNKYICTLDKRKPDDLLMKMFRRPLTRLSILTVFEVMTYGGKQDSNNANATIKSLFQPTEPYQGQM